MNNDNISFPYQTLEDSIFGSNQWFIEDSNNNWIELPQEMAGWSYKMNLRLRRKFSLDIENIFKKTGLPENAEVKVVCSCFCQSTNFKKLFFSSEPISNENRNFDAQFTIYGEDLSGSILIQTELVLTQDLKFNQPFVAKKTGSRLAYIESKVFLEGSGSSFPTTAINFENESSWIGSQDAFWHLEWESHALEVPVLRDVRLYINSKHQTFIDQIKDPNSTMSAVVSLDVMRRMITGAMMNEDFIERFEEYPPDSVGDVVSKQIQNCFPGRDLKEIHYMFKSKREKFETGIQGAILNFK